MGYLIAGLIGGFVGLIVSAVEHSLGSAKDCPYTTMNCGYTYYYYCGMRNSGNLGLCFCAIAELGRMP